jgi:hypothetical protein
VVRITWYVLEKGWELGMKRGWHGGGAGTAIVGKKKGVGSLARKPFFLISLPINFGDDDDDIHGYSMTCEVS